MKEYEFKYLVKKDFFYKLLNDFKHLYKHTNKIKTNYYYDTDDFALYKNNITLRIIQTNDELYLQKKTHISNNSFAVSEESSEIKINRLPSEVYIPQFNEKAKLLGSLVTNRCTICYNNNIQIMFDENYYLGITDYEIEVEFKDNISFKDTDLKVFLCLNHNKIGKYSRFAIELLSMDNCFYSEDDSLTNF